MGSRARRTSFSTAGRVSGTATAQSTSGYTLRRDVTMTQILIGTLAGGNGTYRVSSVVPALPAGMSASVVGGNLLLDGTPPLQGFNSYRFTVTDTALAAPGVMDFRLTVVSPVALTQYQAVQPWTAGQAIIAFQPVVGTGGLPPLVMSISPSLPTGMTFDTTSGLVYGTPDVSTPAGTTLYTVTGADSLGGAGSVASNTFSASVANGSAPVFTVAAPPGGTVGVAYDYQFVATGAVSYSLGSGTPTVNTIYQFIVNATNAVGTTPSALKTVSIAAASSALMTMFDPLLITAYGVDAPWADPSPGGGGWNERSGNAPFALPPLTNLSTLPTLTYNGTPRLRPIVEASTGLNCIEYTIVKGDPVRYQGNRSGVIFDSPRVLLHGIDYWFAVAFRLVSGWNPATSGQRGDSTGLFDTHQESATATANPWGITINGPGSTINGFSTAGIATVFSGYGPNGTGGSGVVHVINPYPLNQWMRFAWHYRSGSNAIVEMYYAAGNAGFSKLSAAYGAYPETSPFGDSLTANASNKDYFKSEIYKWGQPAENWGTNTTRVTYASAVYFGQGANLLSEAQQAVAAYATNS
jgi:hypothetical protein